MHYKPKPVETNGIKIPASLRGLVERLAENNHDLWAKYRIAEGWKHGPQRNDMKKTHPDLVPYAFLFEADKDYDRASAGETLKVILALGYRVLPPEKTPENSPDFKRIENRLEQGKERKR